MEPDFLRDQVMAELLACYGEGENTDWPYLTDLCEVIVGMILKYVPQVVPK
jgi:dTDP-D-glucose 4,6-dehydratase